MTSYPSNERPLVSFIVASYNYEQFVGTTLSSILAQTMPDFEVIVIDDCSQDGSLAVIRSFEDPRIKLHINEQNIGLIRTYNKAVTLARGDYINYVDADDWIEPNKLEVQLTHFRSDPSVDIVATYAKFFDARGEPHASSAYHEALINQPHDLNDVAAWIGAHKIASCSVLLRRSVFDRIGLRDESMTTASDYELWARANARGCRFGIVESPLLCYRLHGGNASGLDPITPFLEMAYTLQNAVLPTIIARGSLALVPEVYGWILHTQSGLLTEDQACRLLGLLANPEPLRDCAAFKNAVLNDGDAALLAIGKRLYATYRFHPAARHSASEIAWRNNELAARRRDIEWRDNELAARARDIDWRDEEIARRDGLLTQRDTDVAKREQAMRELDAKVAALTEAVASRDRDLAWRDNELAARARDIEWRNEEIARRDRMLAQRDTDVAALEKAVHDLDASVAALTEAVASRDRDLVWRDNELAVRARDIEWRDNELVARARDIAWRDEEIARRDREIARRDQEIVSRVDDGGTRR
jgi:GT2 family glycosyltransferase